MRGWSRSRRREAYLSGIAKRGGNAAFFVVTVMAGQKREARLPA
jgi:hypothetical protein